LTTPEGLSNTVTTQAITNKPPSRGASRSASPRRRLALLIAVALTALSYLAAFSTAPAGAVTDAEDLGSFGGEGHGSGQFFIQGDMASDPSTGHLYVADKGNWRIDVFTPWGGFVEAFGWGVADGAPELQTCVTACLSGLRGSGTGQFSDPGQIAVDTEGNVYVREENRIQKFDSLGHFELMFGSGVASGGAAGSGDLALGSPTVTSLSTTRKRFETGQTIIGAGIPADTKILDVGVGTLTLSRAATSSGEAVALVAPEASSNAPVNERDLVSLEGNPTGGTFTVTIPTGTVVANWTAGSTEVTNTHQAQGTFQPGDQTTIVSATGEGHLAEGSKLVTDVSTKSGAFSVGEPIIGRFEHPEISPGTTIVAIGPSTLTLSAPAHSTEDNVGLTAHATVASIDGSGSFTLSAPAAQSGGQSSGSLIDLGNTSQVLSYDATSTQVREAFEGMPSVPSGSVEVTGPAGGPWTVDFSGALLGDTDFPPVGQNFSRPTGDNSGLSPGASVTVSSVVRGGGSEEVCTAGSGDDCAASVEADAPGHLQFGALALDGKDILAGGDHRIQTYTPDGVFVSEVPASGQVDEIAGDEGTSSIYAIFRGQDDIHRLSNTGTELGSIKVASPEFLTADPDGMLYTTTPIVISETPTRRVVEFNAGGSEVATCCLAPLVSEPRGQLGFRQRISGLTTNSVGDLYVSNVGSNTPGIDEGGHISFYGPGPVALEDPPKAPPTISAQFASTVDTTSATLKAQVNPNFWKDTRFRLEYGTEPCSSESCIELPASPGILLGAGAVKKPVTSPGINLDGLTPGTTYHYRFVAESGGGGPVIGVGGEVGKVGAESTFTTFGSSVQQECPGNQSFRTGPGANLPDCRAYEMVSPIEKGGGDVFPLRDVTTFENRLDQSSVDGERFTYSSYRAFGGAEGAPWTGQYLARRGSEGWTSEALASTLSGKLGDFQLENEFKAFSDDLCQTWILPDAASVLAPGAMEGFPNLYRRDNCPKSYETLTTATPSAGFRPEFEGHSADGSKSIFQTKEKLTEDARGGGASQLYEASEGDLKAVCIFPEGTAPKVEVELPNCWAGSPPKFYGPEFGARTASVHNAISEDGSRIYWSAGPESKIELNPGRIYLRLNATATVPVSETETTKAARFWGASADGSKALFEVEDPSTPPTAKNRNLYLYDLATEASSLIAGKVLGVAAQSEDLSRVYYVSEEAIEGEGQPGEPNLYLYTDSTSRFIATLAHTDVPAENISDTSPRPIYHVARATPDGSRLAFISTNALTGFDNIDAASGEADSEVFTYDATSGGLSCVSCSPAGVRPAGRDFEAQPHGVFLWSAAAIPYGETTLYQPRALSDNGARLFFTSYTDLLPADTNGTADVYEWERAGAGSCSGESDPAYHQANDGCLYLISNGTSPSDSELVDSSPEGRDVFFSTNASLLPQDPGLVDIYDAREGGGLPPPPSPPAACEGEACQGPYSPPEDPTPASAAFKGSGNVAGPGVAKARLCKKGKAKKHVKCVQRGKGARGGKRHGRTRRGSR
jgi:hypothetical protein